MPVTASMRAQRIHEWGGPLILEDAPVPQPGPGEALVQVEACGVGGTVINCVRGNLGSAPEHLPRIPGHEFVGTVVESGPGVSPGRLPPGQRVMAYLYLSCNACVHCLAGRYPLCDDMSGYVGVHRDGGYAEYVALPVTNLLPVPDGVSGVDATVIPDAVATPYHVCRQRAGLRGGERVVIIGAAGGVGAHLVQMAALFGADVTGIDVDPDKLRQLPDYGADRALDFRNTAPGDIVEATRGGADVVIDLVGREETLSWAAEALAKRGRLVILTTFHDVFARIPTITMVNKEMALMGSRYCSKSEVLEAARLVQEGRIRPVISETVPLDAVGSLHQKLQAGTLLGRGAVTPA